MPEANEENFIMAFDEDGEEVKLNILFTFHSEELDKSYVIVYEDQDESDEEIELQAFSYEETSDQDGQLHAIETEEEWDMVEEVLATFIDESPED
ncbi:MAG: DUF1292 domain-containing protein [Atopococcus tabaci]|uniref:UPF0473 protein Q4F26_05475 n=1 Tax=Atopococcus tabaci TaxID=269774 RepID=A0AA43UD37_9LACT|nr:DUF1292 domain-containing protein [Atopococcus tabaci]